MQNICGWNIEKKAQFRYIASSGNVRLTIKSSFPAEYRQLVFIKRIPPVLKIIKKKKNSFMIYQNRVPRRGLIDLGYEIDVYPIAYCLNIDRKWGKIEDIQKNTKNKYKEGNPYWPLENKRIKEITEMDWFKENKINIWIKNAIDFLWSVLKNVEPQKERLGPIKALKLSAGDCDEFTDIFITLARLRGLPSRRITGMYIENDNAEMHAWSEIYTPIGEWIIVDPAMMNAGNYRPNYVILKVEEFNPSIPEYQISWKGGKLKYEIEESTKIKKIIC